MHFQQNRITLMAAYSIRCTNARALTHLRYTTIVNTHNRISYDIKRKNRIKLARATWKRSSIIGFCITHTHIQRKIYDDTIFVRFAFAFICEKNMISLYSVAYLMLPVHVYLIFYPPGCRYLFYLP